MSICCVCRESDNIVKLPCNPNHEICGGCLFTILRSDLENRCPVCRAPLIVTESNVPSAALLFGLMTLFRDAGMFDSEDGKQALVCYMIRLLS